MITDNWNTATRFLHEQEHFHSIIVTPGLKLNQVPHGVLSLFFLVNCILFLNGSFLTIFNSSHKLNTHDYNLFTFMCHNKNRTWVPGVRCLVERENSDILAVALCSTYAWSGMVWKMHYL